MESKVTSSSSVIHSNYLANDTFKDAFGIKLLTNRLKTLEMLVNVSRETLVCVR